MANVPPGGDPQNNQTLRGMGPPAAAGNQPQTAVAQGRQGKGALSVLAMIFAVMALGGVMFLLGKGCLAEPTPVTGIPTSIALVGAPTAIALTAPSSVPVKVTITPKPSPSATPSASAMASASAPPKKPPPPAASAAEEQDSTIVVEVEGVDL